MNHVLKSVRVLLPSDFRLIWRDGLIMSAMLFVMPLAGWGSHYALPWIADLVRAWVELEPYFGLILAGLFLAGQPVLIGFLLGVLFVEERDQGTLLALRASPLSLRTFVCYRMALGGILSVTLTTLTLVLAGLVRVSWAEMLGAVALATLSVPVIVLVYATYVANKVQALMLAKPLQTWGGLPAFLFFAPIWAQWIGGMVMPMYFPIRFFWGASRGESEWWLLLPGIAVPLLATAWLWQRFVARTS